jgi:putative dimethyl sulfoxide reductase chaperone
MKSSTIGWSGGLALADIASGRAAFYGLLIAVFEHLPGQDLLAKIRDGEFERLLASYRELGEQGIRAGLDKISTYQIAIRERPEEDVLTKLSVDRTRILRGTGHKDMKPPYEGLYKKGTGFGDSVLGVKLFYRRSGLVPDESVSDSADYLCVELDFMKQLCLREEALRLREGEFGETIAETIVLQEEFLRLHLGNWVGDFCSAVEKHASTDFYRGFALILDAYIRMDRKWLGSLRVLPRSGTSNN